MNREKEEREKVFMMNWIERIKIYWIKAHERKWYKIEVKSREGREGRKEKTTRKLRRMAIEKELFSEVESEMSHKYFNHTYFGLFSRVSFLRPFKQNKFFPMHLLVHFIFSDSRNTKNTVWQLFSFFFAWFRNTPKMEVKRRKVGRI